MGVIQRQSLKHSIVNFAGLLIGITSTLFLYPHLLQVYGLITYLLSLVLIGLPLLSFGATMLSVRFFPYFEDKTNGNNGFLGVLLLLAASGCTLVGVLLFLGWPWVLDFYRQKDVLQQQYFWVAIPMGFLYVFNVVLSVYSANFKRIVVPSILLDFSQKLMLPSVIFAVWQGWIGLPTALFCLVLHSFFVQIGLLAYLRWLGQLHVRPNWAHITPELRRDMLRFALFGSLGGFALVLAYNAQVFFVGSLISLKSSAVYTIAVSIAAVFDIPIKAIYTVSTSFVSKYLAAENYRELGDLYQKGSINLLIGGLFLLGGVWMSVDQLYALTPNSAEVGEGKYVLLFLGLAKLVEMSTGLNNYIIYYSRYYYYSLVSQACLAVASISFTAWLVPQFGFVGAAIAVLLAVSCYNMVNLRLVWLKFGIQPFTSRTPLAIGLAIAVFSVVWWIPLTGFPLLDIAIRSGLYALVFSALVLRLGLSPDLNEMVGKYLKR